MSGTGPAPIWRRDFPYTSEGEERVTRREFARYLVAASIAVAGSGGVVSLWASLRSINTGVEQEIVPIEPSPGRGRLCV